MIKFTLETTNPSAPLAFEAWLDDCCVYKNPHVTQTESISFAIPDDEAEHQLRLILKNKQIEHTVIDEHNNIIKDSCLKISNLFFDDIELTYGLQQLICYSHNNNGNGPDIEDKFYGAMGCNGTASLKFSTPIYLWLLENM